MTKFFSPLNALKVGLTSLALAGTCLMANTASAYVRTQGTQIVDDNNQPLFFNGTNLGNWLVWEGYMMVGDFDYRTHTQFFWGLETAFGTPKAIEFERAWRKNYVTQSTIQELAGLGYNSVRVPFKWSLLWNDSTKTLNQEGLDYIDNLISWCKPLGVKILLDMHGLPGYQNPGDHSDNLDSNGSHPAGTVHFLDGTARTGQIGANITKAGEAWRAIANYFKDKDTIWGYDIMNEPNTESPKNSEDLLVAQKYIISKIREVDPNHIVVVEGDNWAGYMDMYSVSSSGWNGSLLDSKSNVVLQTHYYLGKDKSDAAVNAAVSDLGKRVKIANDMNVPIILGEFGEDSEPILRKFADAAKASTGYDGSFTWTFKKMFHKYRSLWVIDPQASRSPAEAAYISLRDAIKSGAKFNGSWADLMTFLTSNIQNGHPKLEWWQKYYDATTNSTVNNVPTPPCTRSAYKAVTLPGVVQAEDFDNGCAGIVYADSSTGNAGGASNRNTDVDIGTTADSSGLYVGWTAQGEWVEYTVNVASAGDYTFNFRYASAVNGATVTVTAGSNSVSTNLNSTGGWDTWANATSGKVYLAAGSQVIRVTFNGGSNLNSFSVAAAGKNLPPLATVAITPGKYNIVANSSPYVSGTIGIGLDAPTGGGVAIQLYTIWQGGGGLNQQWNIQPVSGLINTYTIINVSTGKALDVPLSAGCVGDNAGLNQYAPWASDNQRWKFIRNTNGSLTIVSAATPCGNTYEVVDVPDGKIANQSPMQVYSLVPGNINQQWKLSWVNQPTLDLQVPLGTYSEQLHQEPRHSAWFFVFAYFYQTRV